MWSLVCKILSMSKVRVGSVEINEHSLQFKFQLSKGPGGQSVNKVATAVELRFSIALSGLSEAVCRRAIEQGKPHLNSSNELVFHATRHRSQKRNREEVLHRLAVILENSQIPPKPRIPTRPSQRAKQARLDQKRKTSTKKHARKTNLHDDL